jgi:hypothetical protein
MALAHRNGFHAGDRASLLLLLQQETQEAYLGFPSLIDYGPPSRRQVRRIPLRAAESDTATAFEHLVLGVIVGFCAALALAAFLFAPLSIWLGGA